MGNHFALTRPGLDYEDQYTTDPSTGMPIKKPAILKFFPNLGARALQFAKDASQAVQPSTADVTGELQPPSLSVGRDWQSPDPATGPPQAPAPMDISEVPQPDKTSVSYSTPHDGPTPAFFQPSFRQATQDENGLQIPINHGLTKGGALLSILAAAARGGLNAWGTMNPGQGAQAAREIPIQMAAQRQQLQTGGLENQQRAALLRMLPLDIAGKRAQLAHTQAETDLALHGAHGNTYTEGPNGELQYTPIDAFGKPLPPVAHAINPYEMKPHVSMANGLLGVNPQSGEQFPVNFNKATGRYEDQFQRPIPNEWIRQVSMLPQTSSSSQTSDLMGNTQTTNTNQRVIPGAGGSRSPQRGGTGRPPVVRPQANSGRPLAPDVEQRLASAGLSSAEQGYVRGLLNYQGQMPSPRAKNYAATLATLTSIDPSFDAPNYDAIRKTKLDYSPGGNVGQQVLAFNTALRHLGTLDDAIAALKNTNYPAANRVGNALSMQFGNDAVTNFNTIKTYLAGELAKGFGGGVATDASRSEANGILSQVQSPAQLAGGVKAAVDLLRGKIGAQEDAYRATVHQPISLLDTESHGVLQKLGMEEPHNSFLIFRDSQGGFHKITPENWKKNQAAIKQRDPGAQLVQ